jgi:hypothetical protein
VHDADQGRRTISFDRMGRSIPVKLTVPTYILSKVDAQTVQASLVGYVLTAKQEAAKTTAGAQQLKSEWFGALSAGQLATLKGNLARMHAIITVASLRIVQAPRIHDPKSDDHYDSFNAQNRMAVVPQNNSFSIEIAKGFYEMTLDRKINTLCHEFSHRIIATDDVDYDFGGGEVTVYGAKLASRLAAASPDDALNNATNYGYYITTVNGLVNQRHIAANGIYDKTANTGLAQ